MMLTESFGFQKLVPSFLRKRQSSTPSSRRTLNPDVSRNDKVGDRAEDSKTPMTRRVTAFDVETTGVGNGDRVVEIATLTIDLATGEIIGRYETLINPERDIGPTSIHGISPKMVELAPTFKEVAHTVSRQLNGTILVAHNLAFDIRMLMNEFSRIGGQFDPGEGFCTLRATGMKLAVATEAMEVSHRNAHQASSDASASLELAIKCKPQWENYEPAAAEWVGTENHNRTVVRSAHEQCDRDVTSHLLDYTDLSFLTDLRLVYADALDRALNDHVLDSQESEALTELAERLELRSDEVTRIHEQYVASIIKAAQRDGRISETEHNVITRIRSSLAAYGVQIPSVTEKRHTLPNIGVATVCFTGEVVVGGHIYTRPHMESIAALHGIAPKSSVSRNCDLLVAADPASNSGKARRARELKIPIISAAEFIDAYGPEN